MPPTTQRNDNDPPAAPMAIPPKDEILAGAGQNNKESIKSAIAAMYENLKNIYYLLFYLRN